MRFEEIVLRQQLAELSHLANIATRITRSLPAEEQRLIIEEFDTKMDDRELYLLFLAEVYDCLPNFQMNSERQSKSIDYHALVEMVDILLDAEERGETTIALAGGATGGVYKAKSLDSLTNAYLDGLIAHEEPKGRAQNGYIGVPIVLKDKGKDILIQAGKYCFSPDAFIENQQYVNNLIAKANHPSS
jgi:hypothetical protein